MDNVADFFDTISDRDTWVRVAFVLIGAVFLYLALTKFELVRWRA